MFAAGPSPDTTPDGSANGALAPPRATCAGPAAIVSVLASSGIVNER